MIVYIITIILIQILIHHNNNMIIINNNDSIQLQGNHSKMDTTTWDQDLSLLSFLPIINIIIT